MQRMFAVLLVGVCLLTSTRAQEQEEIVDLSADAARITRAEPGAGFAPLAGGTPEETVAAFLNHRHGLDASTAASLTLTAQDASERRVHVRFQQRIAGLDVYGTYVKATLTPAGELVSVIENLAPAASALEPALIDYRDALETALQRRYPGHRLRLQEAASSENLARFARGLRFQIDPSVRRVAIPLRGNRLRVGYVVETWDRDNQLWHTVVSGLGQVIHEELRTASETYRIVFPNPAAPAFVYGGPGSGNVLSPYGWRHQMTTTGNNVDAYLDRNADNVPDSNGRPQADGSGNLLTALNAGQAATTAQNQAASVTNLFVLNNFLHDFLWVFGFNEAAGNFQNDNFGRGGLGNDAVRAEAQDGTGTNNANFAAPLDGNPPRMQMYLWGAPGAYRDSALDADVVMHEYGHGLTWRMVGGMSGALSAALGEGMSDTIALYLSLDDAIGEYSMGIPNGFRSRRYFTHTGRYRDVRGYSVHTDGEVYAAAMARLLQIWLASGRDYLELWWHVIDGLNYTAFQPSFEDMRDGIITSMLVHGTSPQDRCVVWDAFASRGIGYNADGRLVQNGNPPTLSITESSLRAPECEGIPSSVPLGLSAASLKRIPRARIAADIQTALRQRGMSTAKTALALAGPASGAARPAAASH